MRHGSRTIRQKTIESWGQIVWILMKHHFQVSRLAPMVGSLLGEKDGSNHHTPYDTIDTCTPIIP
jgi:hypothetical protein